MTFGAHTELPDVRDIIEFSEKFRGHAKLSSEEARAFVRSTIARNGSSPIFPRSLTLGRLKSCGAYAKALITAGYQIDRLLSYSLENNLILVEDRPRTIAIEITSPAMLGIYTTESLSKITVEANKAGLTVCPEETGLLLRLAYEGQISDEFCIVVSEQIDFNGISHRICLSGKGKEAIATLVEQTRPCWVEPHDKLVFVRTNL